MKTKVSAILLVLVILFACRPNHPSKEYFADVNGQRIPIIRLDLVKDSATLVPLSTLFEDVEIIPLETRPECLIGYSTNFMTDHSVLIGVRNRAAPIRLYEFDLKEKGVGYNIRFKDDLLGILQHEQYGMDCSFYEFGQPNRIVQAFQVLEWIAEAKKGQNLPAAAKERILKLEQNLNENSNPVLFLFKQRTDKELSSRLSQMIH